MADEITVPTPAPAAPATPSPEAAPPAKIEAKSFEEFFDKAVRQLDVSKPPVPETKPVAADPAKPADPAAPAVPPAAAIVPAEAAPTLTPEQEEKQIDDLFATNAGQAFKKLKSDLKEARAAADAERTKLAADIAAAKTGVVPETEVKTLKEQLAARDAALQEYETELAITRVEGTRAYKEHVAKPLAAIRATVDTIAGASTNFKAPDILAALAETDPKKKDALLTEIAADIPERHRFNLYNLDGQYASLAAQEKFVRDNAKEALKIIEERNAGETASRTETQTKEYASALDATWTGLQKEVPFLRPIEGQEKWNAALSDLDKLARSTDVTSLPAPAKAQIIYHAHAFPLAINALNYYAGEVVRLENALKAKETGKPGAGGGNPGASAEAAGKKPVSAGGFLEALSGLK